MNYVSTRGGSIVMSSARAIANGLAPDGGLMVPEVIPRLAPNALAGLAGMSYHQRAVYIMNMFLDDYSASELSAYAAAAYGPDRFSAPSPAPLRELGDGTFCLELFHGPTCAFKDMALQMLPHLLTGAVGKTAEERTVCILAATSGDTGKAALEGFRDVAGTKILVFYPKDGVSRTQELQMVTQEGGNVAVFAVEGNFDDAQSGVKAIFSDEGLRDELDGRGYFLSSANSINWGRLLPQIVYYVSAYCDLLAGGHIETGGGVNFCVPTGNFGNILAACYAREMGVPIRRLVCASNQNNVLTDFFRTGTYDRNRPFHQTMSPSMDILISSNLERLLYTLSGDDAQVRGWMQSLAETGSYTVSTKLKGQLDSLFLAGYCDDTQTKAEIRRVWEKYGYLLDPHTAVASHVREAVRAELGDAPTVVVSTASPFKFSGSVLSALGAEGDSPEALAKLTGLPVPAPLAGLETRARRFDTTLAREGLTAAVRETLA